MILDNIDAVIFDLDGTLVDSMWVWEVIDRRFIGKYHLPHPENLNGQLEGYSFHETAVFFKDFFHLDLSIDEIKKEWNHMAYEMYTSEIHLKPGARGFLKELHRKNIKTGIATSNSKMLTKACLKANHVAEYFHCIKTSDEVSKGKPEPDIYLSVSKELHVPPEKTLVFEDIPYGLMAGKRADMTTCAVWDFYSERVLEKKKELADYYIESYYDILDNTYEVLRR